LIACGKAAAEVTIAWIQRSNPGPQHAADLRRTSFAETASNWLSH
jgi:hypothetical protein